MKESTGGLLLMGLAAVIILLFIIFAAFFINYGKTFKVKNTIINEIEQQEGMTEENIIKFIQDNTKYDTSEFGINPDNDKVCYKKIMRGTDVVGITFKVTLHMRFDRNLLGETFNINIPIRGETRMIESGTVFNSIKTAGGIGINLCN